MKKLSLFLLLSVLLSQTVNAQTIYTLTNSNGIRSNTAIRFSNPSSINRKFRTTTKDAEFMNAFFAGAGLASGRLNMLSNPAIAASRNPASTFLDPYIVTVNNKNYVLVKDSKDNKWTPENILGYNDSRKDLFLSLKQLESDGNASQITVDELKNANIRFVLLNSEGTLELNDRASDFDINKVKYIDMKNLRTALGNKNQDGTFGYFYVIIKDGPINRAYPGRVTFEEKEELNKYIK